MPAAGGLEFVTCQPSCGPRTVVLAIDIDEFPPVGHRVKQASGKDGNPVPEVDIAAALVVAAKFKTREGRRTRTTGKSDGAEQAQNG